MDLATVIGTNLRRLRTERGLTLSELARRSAVSKQTLSQLERGLGNPTVTTLQDLADGLGVSVRRLVSEWATDVWVRRAGDLRPRRVGGLATTDLDAVYGEGWVRTRTLEVHADTECAALTRGARYQVYVLAGQLLIGPTRNPEDLSAGDFIRFPADVEHCYRPLAGPATVHLTATAPHVPMLDPATDEGPAGWPVTGPGQVVGGPQ